MSSPRRLFRNQAAGRIAGVCAGIAEYLDTDVAVVRLAWIVLSIVPGGFVGGLVAYIAAWAIMPDASVPVGVDAGARRLFRSSVDRKIAGVCGGLAEYVGADSTVVRLIWAILAIVPGAVVLGIAAYLVAWFIIPSAPAPLAVVAQSVP
jgi:phage shock protein PspC (stress-responsive transcriptional regulator)